MSKGTECRYLGNPLSGSNPTTGHQSNSTHDMETTSPPATFDLDETFRETDGVTGVRDQQMSDSPIVFMTQAAEEIYDWNNLNLDFLEPIIQSEGSKFIVPSTIGATLSSLPELEQLPVFPAISFPMQPTSTRLLVQRQRTKPGFQKASMLIHHTLRSYPLMMRQNNTLPPFIHPVLLQANIENNDMEALHNCISLLHMLNSGMQYSRKLFWRNVRQECERLCQIVGFSIPKRLIRKQLTLFPRSWT
jgi:hypothetical protein